MLFITNVDAYDAYSYWFNDKSADNTSQNVT